MKLTEYDLDAQLIKGNIEHHFQRLNGNIARDKKKATFVEIYKGVAAASATALLGIGQIEYFEEYNDIFQVFAILITAFLTMITAWDNLFKHKDLWILNVTIRNRFASLRDEFLHAEATDNLGQKQLEAFQDEMKKILASSNNNWTSLRTQEDN